MGKLRGLGVEDSSTGRAHLCRVLSADPEIEIVGETGDGQDAIEKCVALRPDAISLDMILPTISGLAVTEYVMAYCPTPILIVSSSTNRGELFRTYDALAAGAVDVLDKPQGDDTDEAWARRFVAAIKLVSRIRVITHPRARLGSLGRVTAPLPVFPPPQPMPSDRRAYELVALGASTGGPSAFVRVMRALPADYPLPVLIVLHIGEPFGRSFAEWCEGQIGRPVVYATEGQRIADARGRVIMAPPESHLVVQQGRLRLSDAPARHSCRPSIDVLFESIARDFRLGAAACLLTGMGRDGATGLLELRRAGALTIAQDEASSMVYGMPREAALLGAAERILSLDDIGPALASLDPRAIQRRLP